MPKRNEPAGAPEEGKCRIRVSPHHAFVSSLGDLGPLSIAVLPATEAIRAVACGSAEFVDENGERLRVDPISGGPLAAA